MSNIFNIREIAKILGVSAPTLRYWENEEIYTVHKNECNNYREYNMTDLIKLADITFYRSLGIPVKKLKKFETLKLENTEKILKSLNSDINQKILEYQQMLNKVKLKQLHIEEIQNLNGIDYVYEDIAIEKVVRFEYTEKDKVSRYIDDTSCYVKFQNSSDLSAEIRGIVVESDYIDDNVLWENTHSQKFAVFLVKEIASQDYVNNMKEKIDLINKKHRTGIILAQFLLTANYKNKQVDFLKAYVELLD
ncbi:DNA-binding transcriptional regulator, MerR family [Peptoclostridium litorale DSM 5388]|uniref:Transcriptional regulator, MerR family n=1 Tax=Peptoclostridium litorale DSM 5388 TaxID=1121324 RepID=A0A069RHZ4_PEPLI|nr:MerR family transcriptional regulator [Peptoclostridium litorale]KDR95780.1 transcriptional regulator, MerR family [Peptoclostridium litorale DSM 5388]SIO21468.1 DNA-binding transcriptional regulator, MerR family [Peptoclostridium litorale DSM 5388]